MYFSDYTSHSATLSACSGNLPIKMLYFKLVASLFVNQRSIISEIFLMCVDILMQSPQRNWCMHL